jgi:hypothetical protein
VVGDGPVGSEPAHGPPGGHRRLRRGRPARAEHVRRGVPQEVATGPRWVAGETTQQHERGAAGLGADEIRGRGDLVGHGGLGDLERAALQVEVPPLVPDRRGAGDPERDVGLPEAPGPAERVGDDHADVDAGALGELRA